MLKPLNPPIPSWAGQRIWIVGASRGIGAALARELSLQGAKLSLSGRHLAPLDPWLSTLPDAQRERIILSPLDVQQTEQLQQTAQHLLQNWGGIDLVIVAAGVYDAIRAVDFDASHLPVVEQTLSINLAGPYRVAAVMLPILRQQGGGHLSFISSVAGYNGLPRALAYAPSKAALNNLCEGLYFELSPLGIGISRICPGFVATDMTASVDVAMPALIQPEQATQAILAGLARGDFDIHFPRRFTYLLKILQWLPRRCYFQLLRWGLAFS